MSRASARNAPPAPPAPALMPSGEPEVETVATLVIETRGALRRTRFVGRDGVERVTQWRELGHPLYMEAAELRKAWTDSLMDGVGRIPAGAARVYR